MLTQKNKYLFLMIFFSFIFFSHSSLSATTQGYYELENNYNDSSGNNRHGSAVGAGSTFSQYNPLPVRGDYLARHATNNAVDVPTSVFTAGMETTGTVKATFFSDPDSSTKMMSLVMLIHADFGGNGDFKIHTNGSDLEIEIPTTAGSEVHKTTGQIIRFGKWYDVWVNWTSTSLKAHLHDLSTDTQNLVIDVTPTNTPKFLGCTKVLIGNLDDNKAAWYADLPIDTVGFYDTVITDDGILNAEEHQFLTVGNSMVLGTSIPLGYRQSFFNFFKNISDHFNLVGTNNYGADVMAANSGVGGDKTFDVDARITNELNTIFPNTGTRQHIILGPMVSADCSAGTNLVIVKGYIEDTITKIETFNPTINIFLVTDPERTLVPTNVDDYNEKVREVYNESPRKNNGVYLIDVYTQTIELAGDGLHPNATGYNAMGNYIAEQINNIFSSNGDENVFYFGLGHNDDPMIKTKF